MMSQILAGLKDVQCYLDDIIIYGETLETHEQRLKAVLHRLDNSGLKLNMSKCQFRKTELPFLGHVISASGLQPDQGHVTAVADAPSPKDAPTLRSFLGLTSFYSKFVPRYAVVVEPLRALLRKDSTFKWTDETEKAFCQLKELTITSPALALFDPMLPTVTMALVLYNSMATLKRQLLLHHVLLQTVKGNTAQSKRKLLTYLEPDMEMIALVSDDFAAITMEELTAACKDCLILQQVRAYIRTGWPCTAKGLDPALVPYFRIHTELAEHDECVIRGTHRVVVPREIQPKLIQIAHDTHQGIVRTKQRLRELYWWPGMDAAVETAIKSCVTCTQHDKTAIVRASPLNPVSLPNAAWEKLAVDFVGPYLRAPPDCRYAITLVDYYSKWPEVAFTSEVTSATAIKFLSTVFSREGNPIELVTDNGSAFVSAEFEAFLASRDIKHCRSSIYYPRCNGEVERWNRCLKDCLQTADIEGKPWKQFTTDFLFSYRATPHAITQVSPAELLHGRPMNTKLNIRGLPTRPMQLDDAELRDTVKKKQLKSKEYTDKRRSAQIPTFQVGGFVRIKKPTLIKKGAHKFTKPLQIIEQRGPATFRLSDGKMWNASHLAPALPVNMPVPPTPPPPDETHELLQATPPDTALPSRRTVRVPEWHKDYVT